MNNYIELPISGLEGPLSEMEQYIQDTAHKFARDVLRPAGEKIDKMDAEEAVGPDSPLWDVLKQGKELGLTVSAMAELSPAEGSRLMLIAAEELAWGDAGLGAVLLCNNFPAMYCHLAGRDDLIPYCEQFLGCWGITEPDHGTDMLDGSGELMAPDGDYGRPNCTARIEGDKVFINGQKSAWVSNAMIAELCVLYCHVEENGETRPGVTVLVPLDQPGVTKGKPLDKIGFRGLSQGELYFDNAVASVDHIIAGPDRDSYEDQVYRTLAEANVHVANLAVGVARAAYEHALAYAHERKAGGQKIILHQNVKYRLFHMFRKIEAARALARRVAEYNATAPQMALQGSTAAKVNATQSAFEVASDAVQIFGGNGVTKEYPVEKLMRDARAGLIADGCNEMLALKGGSQLVNPELL